MIELVYLSENNNRLTQEEYNKFLLEYYKNEYNARLKRIKWYQQYCSDFKILLAIINGKPVGQSCAYKCTAVIHKQDTEWWWGVDTFVLPAMRGKGIGKKLQLKLHQDLPNFSSAWYSPSNGYIKRICGANLLYRINFNYFPVSSYVTPIITNAAKKFLNKQLHFNHICKWKYLKYNNLFINNRRYEEIKLEEKLTELLPLINKSLNQYDFYIKRDLNYFVWKYFLNPDLKYHTLLIYSNNNIPAGIIIFSEIFSKNLLLTPIYAVTLLDIFIDPNSNITTKMILTLIGQYYKTKGQYLDGILSLENSSYFPVFRYPIKGNYLLSTYKGNIQKPYISYSDQDMEQMI